MSMANRIYVPPSSDTLFMRGFSYHHRVEQIRDFFTKEAGRCVVEFNKDDGNDGQFVALKFDSREVAKDVFRRFNDREVLGDRITMTWYKDLRKIKQMNQERRFANRMMPGGHYDYDRGRDPYYHKRQMGRGYYDSRDKRRSRSYSRSRSSGGYSNSRSRTRSSSRSYESPTETTRKRSKSSSIEKKPKKKSKKNEEMEGYESSDSAKKRKRAAKKLKKMKLLQQKENNQSDSEIVMELGTESNALNQTDNENNNSNNNTTEIILANTEESFTNKNNSYSSSVPVSSSSYHTSQSTTTTSSSLMGSGATTAYRHLSESYGGGGGSSQSKPSNDSFYNSEKSLSSKEFFKVHEHDDDFDNGGLVEDNFSKAKKAEKEKEKEKENKKENLEQEEAAEEQLPSKQANKQLDDDNERKASLLREKKSEVEKAYRQDCETLVMVTKLLISKDPDLEDRLQKSLRENLRDIGHRCIQELRDFVDRINQP